MQGSKNNPIPASPPRRAALGRRDALGKTFELVDDGDVAAIDASRFFGPLAADAR